MAWTPPEAWTVPEPEWVTLAPGVRWLLQRPNGAERRAITAEVAAMMGRIYQGRADLALAGLDQAEAFEEALSLERLAGVAGVLTGILFARACLKDWSGMEPDAGDAPSWEDADAVKAALLFGAPAMRGEAPLLEPFLAWLEGARRPMGAECLRLTALAEDHWSGGPARCRACQDEGDPCAKGGATDGQLCPRLANTPQTSVGILAWDIAQAPGMWAHGSMAGVVTGFDIRSALLTYERLAGQTDEADIGAAFAAFRAIEGGRLTAEAKAAEARKAADV